MHCASETCGQAADQLDGVIAELAGSGSGDGVRSDVRYCKNIQNTTNITAKIPTITARRKIFLLRRGLTCRRERLFEDGA
jgi:hypothetical protein